MLRNRCTPTGTAAVAAATLLVGVLLAGCGGGSGPSKSQYVAKADAVCGSTSTQTTPLIRKVATSALALSAGGASAVARLAGAVGELYGVASASLEKLRKLEQPSGAHAAIGRFLAPYATVVGAIGEAATSLGEGKVLRALTLLEQVRSASEQATSGARAYGLTRCETVLSALA
ncbi:MAG TPA: hypothetical protein VMF09_06395 [Solirubrobacteraceae bacterium]|nr:hypothetical protein [Solirubrobacteraceae bacterium]